MFYYQNIFTICVILLSGLSTLVVVSAANSIPPSPCPMVFNYYTNSNGDVFGRVTLIDDGSSRLIIGMNVSMKGYYTDRQVTLKISMLTNSRELTEGRTKQLLYDVYFPFQHTIPKITEIKFNNRIYCTGPPEELTQVGVTSLWAQHEFSFQRPSFVPIGPTEIATEQHPFEPQQIHQPAITQPQPTQPLPTTSSMSRPTLPPSRNQNYECGISKIPIVPLILGGADITDGMFPWLAAMFTSTDNYYEYKCTGNLVSNKHVITAARCVSLYKLQIVNTEDILFVFGKTNLKNWATSRALTRGASAVTSNPDFDSQSSHGDISVITLDEPVEFTATISPICLWKDDISVDKIVDQTGTVAGWGRDGRSPKKNSIAIAKSIDIPVVSQETCLFSNLSYYSLTSDSTFCAGKRDGNGVSIGDSGAGFMMKRDGKYYLRGVASLILGDLSNYMIFCDVAKFSDWLKKVMSN